MLSQTEENYIKAIYKICESEKKTASTNAIAKAMSTSAASVSDMLKRLAKKDMINYKKHRGVTLTQNGHQLATTLVRKHRLWEVFLVDKLDFSWDEVHDVAEQLEHIQSDKLVNHLDTFLGHPKFDPHGDPIPDKDGNFTFRKQVLLSDLNIGEKGVVVGVDEHSSTFLQYLDQLKLQLGVELEVLEKFDYDESKKIKTGKGKELIITHKVCQNLFVQKK